MDQRRLIDVVVGDGFLPGWSSLEPGTPDDPVGNGFWGPTIAPDLDDVIVPPPPPPPLPPPPGDALAILNRLDAYAKDDFERQIMIMEAVSRIGLQMATIAGHLSEIDLRLSELEARPAPEYVGSIRFLGTVTLRPKV